MTDYPSSNASAYSREVDEARPLRTYYPFINPLAEDPFENENYALSKLDQQNEMYSFYVPDRVPVILDCGDVMMTKQEFKDECDIENILKQFSKTGIIEHVTKQEAQWLELPDQHDYQQALNSIMEAEAAFDSLPAIVREKYENDPAQFLAALADPDQKDYLTEVGIFAPKWVADANKTAGATPAPAATPET